MIDNAARKLVREVKMHAAAYEAGHRARRAAASGDPLVVGPWTSEVGFELLYWIPFLRHLFAEHGVGPEQVVAVSRGGVADWYAGVASTYVDVLDIVPPQRLQEDRAERMRQTGGEKQMVETDLDREILAAVAERLGEGPTALLHPSILYRRYRSVWMRRRPVAVVEREVCFRPLSTGIAPAALDLPEEYAVVRAYHSGCFPASEENRHRLHELVERVARRLPVVLLTNATPVDEHLDAEMELRDLVTVAIDSPATNLGVQTAVVRDASALISTYGGFSYLGALMGVPTIAFYSHDTFNTAHLDLLNAALSDLRRQKPDGGHGRFALANVRQLDLIGLMAGDG